MLCFFFFFSSRRRHTRCSRDWSSDVCSSDLAMRAVNVGPYGATITWTTNEASDSQVEYGPTTAYGRSTARNASLVTSHPQTLSGLTAGTLYHYRVKSQDAAGARGARGGGGGGKGGPPPPPPPPPTPPPPSLSRAT